MSATSPTPATGSPALGADQAAYDARQDARIRAEHRRVDLALGLAVLGLLLTIAAHVFGRFERRVPAPSPPPPALHLPACPAAPACPPIPPCAACPACPPPMEHHRR